MVAFRSAGDMKCQTEYLQTSALAFLLAVLLINQVSSSGVFELRLLSLSNEDGRDACGQCCSETTAPTTIAFSTTDSSSPSTSSQQPTLCSGVCNTYFRVCLQHYQSCIDFNSPCTFGNFVTPVLGSNSLPDTDAVNFTNPIRLPFNFSWPGKFSLVVEAWHESDFAAPVGGSNVLITRLATKSYLSVGEEWIPYEDGSAHARLQFEYRVHCNEYYYGDGCKVFCRPRNDFFGHYGCSEQGARRCLAGWKGEYCTDAVCAPGCDEHHGFCEEPNECQCRTGWQSHLCDQCIRYPGCLHGTCNTPWECNCDKGWGGLFCNRDFNG